MIRKGPVTQNPSPDKALEECRALLSVTPDNPEVLSRMGSVFLNQLKTADAEICFRRALTQTPGYFPAVMGLGMALKLRMRNDEALEHFRRAVEIDPASQDAWRQLSSTLELLNRLGESEAALKEAKARFPDWVPSVIELRLARRLGRAEEAIRDFGPQVEKMRDDLPGNFQAFFEMGHIHDAAGNYPEAFDYFHKGNQCLLLNPAVKRFDKKTYPARIEAGLAALQEEWSETPPCARPEPVFIVGFPRSGTTLLDQVLYSHPDVSIAEESPALMKAVKQAEKMGTVESLHPGQIEELRSIYYQSLKADGADPDKKILIDKNPLNMTNAGMIHRLFPGAKIILVLRHPCDCVLSCYMQPFGLNQATVHFLELGSAARLYDRVFKAWNKYQAALPLNVHVVKYEDMVGSFRPTMESVLGFIGLSWTDELLAFDRKAKERGAIRTASYGQVSEKISDRSVGRWLHYRAQMEPVLRILTPWVRSHGYPEAAS